ncbi:glycosyltransferase family 2 protein [Prevotella melaninogenica]|uniref:glycosyltransferase family 2 protein n=1 Tax=Prevotella melaninogenica TaxID=28132 RepID=UPI001C5DDD67|nr:glycosyltransferase family A protein [Prevotella melaninogenica]MBW4899965.1 glycosyltransferase family 2 protein [Prevotella melaninogenica]
MITIFTPTYNRAGFLHRLYDTLILQTYKNFEWIIVDDGSKDNTKDVVSSFVKEGKLNIHYVQQENGGKHRAINTGVGLATGELFFILDSDDILPNNALELVVKTFQPIKHEMFFAGVSGIDGNFDGRIIGSGLPYDSIDCNSVDIRYKFHVTGDMKEVFRTSVMKEFPFPDIEGEKFCPEALVWNRIAQKYKLRYFNKIIYKVEYQPEGITSNIVKVRMKSPITSMMCYAEMLELNIPFKDKFKAAVNYWRFRLCYNGNGSYPKVSGLWNAVAPLGWLMHLKDKRVNKR